MATGITKREQMSTNATTAHSYAKESSPLPPVGAEARLAYPNKAPVSEIIHPVERKFVQLADGNVSPCERLPRNSYILGDNYFALQSLLQQREKVTLYYLDPPYGTGFDFQSRNLEHAYEDRLDAAAYIEFMRRRLILMRETMSDNGSIYVHIGHQMLGHIKIVMDEIFGANNFRNIITRKKCSSKNFTSKQYANLNDFILFYSKSKKYKWNKPGATPDQDWIEKEYPKLDEYGRRYKLVPIHAPGTRNGETGQPWKGMNPPPGKHWQYTPSKLDELDEAGDIHWSRNGNPRKKVYWRTGAKKSMTDYWDQYRDAHHQSVKITGYPTEKNLDMVKMIVEASSDPGDLVVDPFCGSGTTMQAARDLQRDYIGMDSSFASARTALSRLRFGSKPMGDYVTKATKTEPDQAESIDSIDITSTLEACSFTADSSLFDSYQDEMRGLSQI